jgi:hypothetical protein
MWAPKRFFTPEQVENAMTPRGGFSRRSLDALGVPWPPPKGWRKAITVRQANQRQEGHNAGHRALSTIKTRVAIAERIARDDRNDDPKTRTPEEWEALIPKLGKWSFKKDFHRNT